MGAAAIKTAETGAAAMGGLDNGERAPPPGGSAEAGAAATRGAR